MRNTPRKNAVPADKRLWLVVALIVLAAAYVLARPTVERWLGIDLPALVEEDQRVGQSGSDGPDRDAGESGTRRSGMPNPGEDTVRQRPDEFELEQIGRDTWRSPAGLVYTMGPNREHRIDHILRHSLDDPDRPGAHGVFLPGDRISVLQTIDDAWLRGRAGGRGVQRSNEEGKTVLTVDLGRTIGYVGGRDGAGDEHPETTRLKLVVDGDRVITAYPTWPRR